jgi:hypothetical protein
MSVDFYGVASFSLLSELSELFDLSSVGTARPSATLPALRENVWFGENR